MEAYEAFASSPAALVAAFLLGTLWGSFANVCIYRWPPTDEHPKGRSVVFPGSHCGACGKPVRWYDNVPILSYLWLRGQCRDCKTRFSPRYLLVEAVTGVLFAVMWWYAVQLGAHLEHDLGARAVRFFVYACLVVVLVVITFIDLDYKLILDRVTYPAIPACYVLGLLLPEMRWYDGLIGAALGYGIVRLIADGYWLLTKREGMGYGDGKLLALIGAILGWQGVVMSLFGGAVVGSVIGIAALVATRRPPGRDDEDQASIRHVELPFGPFLATAAIGYILLQPWLQTRLFPWA